jgi:hypothetical protein
LAVAITAFGHLIGSPGRDCLGIAPGSTTFLDPLFGFAPGN